MAILIRYPTAHAINGPVKNIIQSRKSGTATIENSIANIVTWILLVSMILTVVVKVAMKLLSQRTFELDDAVLILAMVSTA